MIVLETERLIFRPHEPSDRDAYCAMEQDSEVRRYVGAPRTREAAEAKFQSTLQAAQERLKLWATVLKTNGSYIGRCGIYPHFEGETAIPDEGTLSFYIARQYWGQGFASEAASAFVRFGFEQLRLKRIVATVQAENRASLRVLEKAGFDLIRREEGARTFCHFALLPPKGQP